MVKGQSASLRMRGLTQLRRIRASLATESFPRNSVLARPPNGSLVLQFWINVPKSETDKINRLLALEQSGA